MIKHILINDEDDSTRVALCFDGNRLVFKHLAGKAPSAKWLPYIIRSLIPARDLAAMTPPDEVIVSTRKGMSGCFDLTIRRCRDMDLFDYPIECRVHITMSHKIINVAIPARYLTVVMGIIENEYPCDGVDPDTVKIFDPRDYSVDYKDIKTCAARVPLKEYISWGGRVKKSEYLRYAIFMDSDSNKHCYINYDDAVTSGVPLVDNIAVLYERMEMPVKGYLDDDDTEVYNVGGVDVWTKRNRHNIDFPHVSFKAFSLMDPDSSAERVILQVSEDELYAPLPYALMDRVAGVIILDR